MKYIYTNNLTSQDFSWLQKGQLNITSRGSIVFLLGGGLDAFLRRPISICVSIDIGNKCTYKLFAHNNKQYSKINNLFQKYIETFNN